MLDLEFMGKGDYGYGKVSGSGVGSWTMNTAVIAALWIVNWFYAEFFV